jgi:hypothetical protein
VKPADLESKSIGTQAVPSSSRGQHVPPERGRAERERGERHRHADTRVALPVDANAAPRRGVHHDDVRDAADNQEVARQRAHQRKRRAGERVRGNR